MPDQPSDDFAHVASVLGAKVRARRLSLGITQEALALRVGTDRKSIQNVEYGRSSTRGPDGEYGPGNPKLDTIFRIALMLQLDLGYLVDPQQPVRAESAAR